MDTQSITSILDDVAAGRLCVAEASVLLEQHTVSDLGFARVDFSRSRRCGLPEVIFSQGKTPGQVASIAKAIVDRGQNLLATRVSSEQAHAVQALLPDVIYDPVSRTLRLYPSGEPSRHGLVVVAAAGTADLPVAEEAAVVLRHMGAHVETVYDVGVAGLHRMLPHVTRFRQANALVVVAGMEGALPSVIGGLVDRPVIGVPTSVGYGMNLDGLSALLGMLNSCAAGITVVNVDNGFGAGVAAAIINRMAVGA